MTTMLKVGLTLAAGLLVNPVAHANNAVGTSGGLGLGLRGSARSQAMGGAGVAGLRDPAAIWINPAQIGLLDHANLSLMHGSWIEGVLIEQGAVAVPSPGGTVGGALSYVGLGDFQSFDALGTAVNDTFSPSDFTVTGAYALRLDILAFGVSGSYLRSQLAEDAKATALFAGGGVTVSPMPGLTAAFAAQNVGSDLTYDTQSSRLPVALRGGAAYREPRYGFSVAADAVKARDRDVVVHAGAEKDFSMRGFLDFALRAGWQSDAPRGDVGGVTAGLGLFWHPGHRFADSGGASEQFGGTSYRISAVRVDYAWTPMGELGMAHWFSLGLQL